MASMTREERLLELARNFPLPEGGKYPGLDILQDPLFGENFFQGGAMSAQLLHFLFAERAYRDTQLVMEMALRVRDGASVETAFRPCSGALWRTE